MFSYHLTYLPSYAYNCRSFNNAKSKQQINLKKKSNDIKKYFSFANISVLLN